jgi:peptidoglycan/LPS O-acetylase OafA/YrhL
MDFTRIAVVALVPSIIVALRFVWPGSFADGYTSFFAFIGFLATMVGCLIAVVMLRRRAARVPFWVLSAISIVVAAALLAVFPLMPSWPFTGEGFIVVWVAMAAVFTVALLVGASLRYV